MSRCSLCGHPLARTAAWKGRGERYYCSEFCAESETPSLVPIKTPAAVRQARRGSAAGDRRVTDERFSA
jgi:hypothetical protein